MANEIVTFESIANELSVRPDGVAKCTIRGAARICDVEDSSLRRAFQSAAQKPSKLSEALMNAGFDGAAQNAFSEEGIPDQALTIIIEYYAYDAGRHSTAQAKSAHRAFASIGIRALVWKIKGFEEPRPSSVHAVPSRAEAIADMEFMNIAGNLLIEAGVDPILVKAHVLTKTAMLHPALAPQIEAVKQLVPSQPQLHSEEILLKPTDIGQRFNPPISARSVNNQLVLRGLQIRTGNSDAPYELTEDGKKYGKVTLNQAANSSKTVQQVRWSALIVDVLQSGDLTLCLGG